MHMMGDQYTSTMIAPSMEPQLQTDAPQTQLPTHSPALGSNRSTPKRPFSSLNRSLKVFLRASNLPGLEYRLRLARYYTLSDLLDANVEVLCDRGFTMLMARRLLNALEEYIQRHLDEEEGANLPFKLVRRGQKISMGPSELMKALPTYGKQNVKRHKSVDNKRSKPSKLAAAAGGVRNKAAGKTPSRIRLMSEETLKQQHFVLPTTLEEVGRRHLQPPENVVVSGRSEIEDDTVFDANDIEEVDHTTTSRSSSTSPLSSSYSLIRSVSIPADLKWSWGRPPGQEPLPWYLQYRVRCYSSPGSLASPPITTIESLVSTLTSTDDTGIVYITLRLLITKCKHHPLDTKAQRLDATAAVADALQKMCDLPDVAVLCCKVLKYLTRDVLPEPGWLPAEVMSAVLLAVDYNLANVRVLTQACLALANIGRADPILCRTMLFDGGLQSLSSAMKAFHSNSGLQIAAMSALAVALASVYCKRSKTGGVRRRPGNEAVPDSRLHVLTEHVPLLDLVLCTAENFPSSAEVQQYVCAFHALLLAEVSVQIEDAVILLVVEHAVGAMGAHSHDPHVTLWGSKVIAHAASNAVLCDWKLAGQCCELLVEALTAFSESSQVQTWAAYALLQLANHHHRISIRELLLGSSVLGLCQCPHPTLSSEAHHYLHLLGGLADTMASPWKD